jgi:hypothetical protein
MKAKIVNKLKEIESEKVKREILEGLTADPRYISPKILLPCRGLGAF